MVVIWRKTSSSNIFGSIALNDDYSGYLSKRGDQIDHSTPQEMMEWDVAATFCHLSLTKLSTGSSG